ncbi:Ig-like domain-containing alpha-2-macroglobulin family protein [Larkinella soli]|uniref:Ig-like domain-containing alpha-2-macroglobulin family protein n=1 Tax=Larkinella soli TaxID=1770527 RepID=UPI000FFBCD7D|nr:Ig-like domain-containing alpha-2-macroglobulin family protein [Larkinella soli]
MKPLLRLLPAVGILLLFSTCSRLSNDVRVISRNFEDEVARTQNLVFTFSKDLVPAGRLNAWDSTRYVSFEPAIAGKYKWTAPNELVFSPTTALKPATEYRAELTDALVDAVSDRKYGIDRETITFHTPYLQLVDTEFWWTRSRETGRPVAKARLNFNYPVSGSELAGRLKLETEDPQTALTTQISQAAPGETVPVTLPNAPASRNPAPVAVRIEKGLKMQNAAFVTQEAVEQKTALPSQYALEIVDVKTGFENNEGVIRVVTTQELQADRINEYFTLSPEIETRTEPTDNGFLIRGNFNETETYVLTLTKAVKGVLGAALDEEVSRDLFFGKMPAGIAFVQKKALYLSSKGAKNIGVNITNVPQVQVKVAKVYENNILSYVRTGRYEEYGEVDGSWQPMGSYVYYEDEQQNHSDLIVDKTVSTANLPKVRGASVLNLSLPDQNSLRGIYLVTVSSKEQAYMGATKLVSVSDVGLIAKQGSDEVWVFANSIKTAESLANVEVSLVSSNNQVVATAQTNGKGVAHFEKLSEKAPGFKVALITARTGDDFNYLLLQDTRVETSRFEVEGKRDNPSGFDAFVYGDRDIYRPGETMHFNTVVRNPAWESVGQIPLKIRILTPNGREYRVFRQNTNEQGAVATDVPIDPAAVTGTYVAEIYNANEVLLASRNLSVEEFIPDRIRVEARTERDAYRTGETVTMTATATNLFGPPATGRTYEMELQLKPRAFTAKQFPEYTFAIENNTSFEKELRQGVTNAQGQAVERFPVSTGYRDIGVLEGRLFVTIFDENSRPINRVKRFDVFTQETFYGVRLADSYVGTNAPLPVDLIAVDRNGALGNGATARVEVVRMDYQTVIEKQDDQLRYVSKKREKVVYVNNLTFGDGKARIRYVPTVSGEYEVRVRRPGAPGEAAPGYTAVSFYAYGYGTTQSSSFEVSSEGQVLIQLDKTQYQAGEKAKALFKTPFDGKLLVTLERNRVLETHVLDTDAKSAELSFGLSDEHLPNVYVTATLIRPLDGANLPLTVAHGFASVPVEDADTKLPVQITAAGQSRSKIRQRISIKTAANAELTVAVVDEGILQLKNFQTPDMHGFFYQKRALEVGSHDLYAFLFPELSIAGSSSTGGDGYELGKRINPLSNGRVKLVALWSGILKADGSGEASFDIAIPQFSGDLRVMAVAYKGKAFGSASKNMKVADPIVISTGAPRFLSPNDELSLPVTISNTTQKPATVTASLKLSGLLQAAGSPTQQLTIGPGQEARAAFAAKAGSAIGTGNITVSVRGLNETFTESTDLTVRPVTSLLKTAQSGVVAAGRSQTIDLTNAFMPGTVRSELVVSRSPMIQLNREFSYLLGYPYGCIEQTISKAFPQLYFAEVMKTIGKPGTYFVRSGQSDLNPTYTVQEAIRRVESMQLFNGGFSMWPGVAAAGSAEQEDGWASAYAVHFLTEAQRAGFEISPAVYAKAVDRLSTRTGTPATEDEVVFDETGGRTVRKVASRQTIYGLYVLALSGQPNRPAMNYYKQNVAQLTSDSRYLLASAFFLTGDARSYNALLPKKYTNTTNVRQSGGSYASPIRNLALVLNTLLEADPDNLQIPVLARQLSQALNTGSYLNTQESAFAVLALGKVAKKVATSTATATLTADGKPLAPFTGKDLRLTGGIAGRKVTLTAQGSGSLYWFTQTEGLSATGTFTEEDAGLRVRREYLTRDGVPASSFRQNDLVVVRITLSGETGVPVDNVVVTDMLPAGFEIENPRLTEPRELPWVKGAATPEHFDVRDDRIHFFTSAGATAKTFYYLVRVVSKGRFTRGPVSADAMYDGSLRSYSGRGTLTIN